MAIGKAKGPPDGGSNQQGVMVFFVAVVSSSTVGTGESCSGARPITTMIHGID